MVNVIIDLLTPYIGVGFTVLLSVAVVKGGFRILKRFLR